MAKGTRPRRNFKRDRMIITSVPTQEISSKLTQLLAKTNNVQCPKCKNIQHKSHNECKKCNYKIN